MCDVLDTNITNIDTKIVKLEMEVNLLKEKEKVNEENQKSIHDLALLVNTLTTNVTHMLSEQRNQGIRITSLEKKPIEAAMYYKRLIIGTIVTTGVGAVIGAIIAFNIGK